MLLTWHNLEFYQSIMARLRKAIAESSVQRAVAEMTGIGIFSNENNDLDRN
jgi:queuine/archaeosine tRNA-ribosyltransferase